MQIVMWWSSCSTFRIFLLLGQLAGEKGPNTSNHGQGNSEEN